MDDVGLHFLEQPVHERVEACAVGEIQPPEEGAVYVAGQLKVPTLTLVIRKCYGMAGMATCNKNDIDLKLAWPSAEWGSLPVEGGVAAAFRREIVQHPVKRLRGQHANQIALRALLHAAVEPQLCRAGILRAAQRCHCQPQPWLPGVITRCTRIFSNKFEYVLLEFPC